MRALERTRVRDRWVAIGLILIPLVLFAPVWVRSDTFMHPRSGLGTDFLVKQWPNGVFVRRSVVQEQTSPFWRSDILAGTPFLGNASSLFFYPPYWLILIVPTARAINLIFALHLGVAAAGLYILARHALDLSRWASAIAALSFALSYKALCHVVGGHLDIVSAIAWLPWTLRAVYGHVCQRQARWIAVSGCTVALSLLSHPPTALVSGLGAALYTLFVCWQTLVAVSPQQRWREAGRVSALVLAPAVALLLGAVQLVPMLALLPSTSRASLSMAEAGEYALPPSLLPTALMPTPLQFPEWSIYLGVTSIVLTAVSLWSLRSDPAIPFWVIITAICAVLSLGDRTPLFGLAYRLVPGVSWTRVPSRFWFLTSLGVAVLAGKGFDTACRLRSTHSRGIRRVWFAIGAAYVAMAAVMLWAWPAWRLEALGAVGLLLPALVWCLLWLHSNERVWMGTTRSLGTALLLILVLDVVWQLRLLMEPASVSELQHASPAVSYLGKQSGIHRTYSVDQAVPAFVATHHQFEMLEGAEPFCPAYLTRLLNLSAGCPEGVYSVDLPACGPDGTGIRAVRERPLDARLLGLLNVRYVVTPEQLDEEGWRLVADWDGQRLYENDLVLSRAFVVGRARVLESQEQVWRALPQTEVKTTALVAEPLPGTLDDARRYQEVRVVARTVNRVRVAVALDRPGLLVVSQTWMPGWRATDNGAAVPVLRVDYALQGVYLEAGEHVVDLVYRPSSWSWGLTGTACGLVAVIALVGLDLVRAKSSKCQEGQVVHDE